MFAPSWISATETLYLWCGGWRPTVALQLLYSKSGAQLDAQLPAFLGGGGLRDGDLGSPDADQLEASDQMQRRTIWTEREIDEAAASAQESLATVKMVELSAGSASAEVGMEREMDAKAEGMRRVLEMADGLRMDTLRAVVALVRPPQDVHFLVTAELHLSMHAATTRRSEPAAAPAVGAGAIALWPRRHARLLQALETHMGARPHHAAVGARAAHELCLGRGGQEGAGRQKKMWPSKAMTARVHALLALAMDSDDALPLLDLEDPWRARPPIPQPRRLQTQDSSVL